MPEGHADTSPQQHLIAQVLPAHSARRFDYRVGLVGSEIIAPNLRTFIG
jgi:hypothetical protein